MKISCLVPYCTFLLASTLAIAGPTPSSNSGWPQVKKVGNQQITLYQPEVTQSDEKLTFTMPVGVKNGKASLYGMVDGSCASNVDSTNKTVTCENVTITDINFPKVDDKKDYVDLVKQTLEDQSFELTDAQLKASIQLAHIKENRSKNKAETQLNTEPPKIYVATDPAALILIDGEPKLKDIPDTNLSRVMNTAFVLVYDKEGKDYYLRAGDEWMTSAEVLGPWQVAENVPQDVLDLQKKKPTDSNPVEISEVIVSTVPAALLQIDGDPEFAPITGTDLMYVKNTKDDIFQQIDPQEYYTLLSGRWYKTTDELNSDATWTYVAAEDLPADFAKIPDMSEKADVLVSVPGSPQAEEAIIRNDIPQVAKVSRSEATATVAYDGEPQFAPITGTDMQYATNTGNSVVLLDGVYYTVIDGVWFFSDSPLGPWTVLTVVPPDIYTIPPTSPVFPLTFVYIYDFDPNFVFVGYTGGYLM